MSDPTSDPTISANPTTSSSDATAPTQTKGIGSLARKPIDITRGGSTKMKFTPTLPLRRKKTDNEVNKDPPPPTSTTPSNVASGRGRGRGTGRGRGAMQGSREPAPMTASGPFAMGPAAMASSSHPRRSALRSTPIAVPSGGHLSASLDSTAPSVLGSSEAKRVKMEENAEPLEVYSDPEDGVEIVDMEQVKGMDWMAPDLLMRARIKSNKGKGVQVKNEESKPVILDASDSEDDSQDLLEHFASRNARYAENGGTDAQELYFFQFPAPFPSLSMPLEGEDGASNQTSPNSKGKATQKEKRVSFASDAKPSVGPDGDVVMDDQDTNNKNGTAVTEKLDGRIGQLEVYASGAVKMRLNNGLLYEVSAATPASFLQHAVHIDSTRKRLTVLGEITKRFIVAPDMEKLLEDVKLDSNAESGKVDPDSITSDVKGKATAQ